MRETKLRGTLLHTLAELQEIAKHIKKKYKIPELSLGDDPTVLLLVEPETDWDVVLKDINLEVQSL
jgi:hypothetical protein